MENETRIVLPATSLEIQYNLDINHWKGIEKEDITLVGEGAEETIIEFGDSAGDIQDIPF